MTFLIDLSASAEDAAEDASAVEHTRHWSVRLWKFISRDSYAWSFDALYMPGFYEILNLEDRQSTRDGSYPAG